MPKHIISLGDLVLDIILPVALPIQSGQHQQPPAGRIEPGGAGNFMIAARHMGLAVAAAGVIGSDAFGAAIIEALQAEGIDTRFVVQAPGAASTLVVVLADTGSGEHTFVSCNGSALEVPYPAGLDDQIAQADALYLQGYTLAEPHVLPMAYRAIEQAEANDVPIYLDVGPFMGQVSPDHVPWIVQRSSLILMTEDEVPLITDGRTGTAAYNDLLARGPDTLVIKQGPSGCTIVTQDWWDRVPGFDVVVVDTVGAGDCFNAAFIAGMFHNLPLDQCGRLANAMGAAAVRRSGAGRSAPTCDEVMEILRQAGEQVNFPCMS